MSIRRSGQAATPGIARLADSTLSMLGLDRLAGWIVGAASGARLQ